MYDYKTRPLTVVLGGVAATVADEDVRHGTTGGSLPVPHEADIWKPGPECDFERTAHVIGASASKIIL